eukprot:scaffold45122_cov40-Phaeocystis_antarctica.AAC.2
MYAVLPPCGQSRHTGTVPVSGGGSGAAGASCSAETSLPMPATGEGWRLSSGNSGTPSAKAAPRVCACGQACKARHLAAQEAASAAQQLSSSAALSVAVVQVLHCLRCALCARCAMLKRISGVVYRSSAAERRPRPDPGSAQDEPKPGHRVAPR